MVNNSTAGLNLLIADKPDLERDAIADAFAQKGGAVHRLGRFWDPPTFAPATVRVYGADSFCLVLQQKLGLTLCSPPDDLLLRVPADFLRRKIERRTLGEVQASLLPAFVKPTTPKQFRGAVYASTETLATECQSLPANTPVFLSEPVTFTAEVRSFVLDGTVLDSAAYEGTAQVVAAAKFVGELAKVVRLPRAVVVDVGLIQERGWAVVEFNAAWGAGLNGCAAEKVLPAVLTASGSS